MARPKSLSPKYRLHKCSGRAYVELDGKPVYLGKHGTAESWKKYHAALAEWAARGNQAVAVSSSDGTGAGEPPTVSVILAAFWRHAQTYYRVAEGRDTGELAGYRQAIRVVKHLYGATAAAEFGPLKLKAVQAYVAKPYELRDVAGRIAPRREWSRNYINKQTDRIQRIFKWAAGNELVPAAVYHALAVVEGLRKGHTDARETAPVRPVADAAVEAVRPLLTSQLRAMVDLQLYTGARPGEICAMRTCDVDTSGDVWVYTPERHKTAHHGHARQIFIGPRAKAVLGPLLKPDLKAHVFSPIDSEAERRANRRASRRTKVQPSQVRRAELAARRRRKRPLLPRFTVNSYRNAIARACDAAFPPPAALARIRVEAAGRKRSRLETPAEWRARLGELWPQLEAWVDVHRWHPHQLRHNAGTWLRKEFGVELARIILGHKSIKAAEIYAEKNVAKAMEIMGDMG